MTDDMVLAAEKAWMDCDLSEDTVTITRRMIEAALAAAPEPEGELVRVGVWWRDLDPRDWPAVVLNGSERWAKAMKPTWIIEARVKRPAPIVVQGREVKP